MAAYTRRRPRQGTLPNTYVLPACYTADLLVPYTVAGRYKAVVNVKNFTDERHFESSGKYQEGVFPGQPSTALFTPLAGL